MEIIELDLLDGRGIVQVDVAGHIETIRVRKFFKDMAMLREHLEARPMLERLAARKCWCDDKEFMVDDYASGNVDHAYSGGAADGETILARKLLGQLPNLK